MKTYDLIVIGSGPAGEKAATQAAWYGRSVAVVERERLGGNCAHKGTVPSKSLRESALHLSGLRSRGIQGLIRDDDDPIPTGALLAHKDWVCHEEELRVGHNLLCHAVDRHFGHARFADDHHVEVTQADGSVITLEGTFVLIATGSRPYRPAAYPFDGENVFDSDDILSVPTIPRSMIVVGGGVIGSEYASMFAALGTEITLVDPRDSLLPFLDDSLINTLVDSFEKMGMELELGHTVVNVEVLDNGQVLATLDDGRVLEAERLLFAAGRSGNSGDLGLENIGITPNRRGLLQVDEHYRTNVPHVYAAGDIIGFPALASTAMDQGRLAACHAFEIHYRDDDLPDLLPYGIYTVPECSTVGLTEERCREDGLDYVVGTCRFSALARGKINGGSQGLLKLLVCRKSHKILGVHIVGDHAAELVHTGLMVMQLGGTVHAFIDAVFNFPTLSEAYKYAAYEVLGELAREHG